MLGTFSKELMNLGKELTPPWSALTSLLGMPKSWTADPRSEFFIFKDPALAVQTMASVMVQRTFPVREEPSSIPREEEDNFRNEAWFFINGVTTTIPMLKMNGAFIKELFGRPMEMINNPTDGLLVDLAECVFGRSMDMMSTPGEYASWRVEDAMTSDDIDKVVVICHSQGGIISSNMVANLLKKYTGNNCLQKLELYTFGCAADEFEVDHEQSKAVGRLVPYIEHYCNLGDIVARLGVLQKREMPAGHYFGEIYEIDKQGHYLNCHYLPELEKQNYVSRKLGKNSRLYGYLQHGSPTYFNPLPEQGL